MNDIQPQPTAEQVSNDALAQLQAQKENAVANPAPVKRTLQELDGIQISLTDGTTVTFKSKNLKFLKLREIKNLQFKDVKFDLTDPNNPKPSPESLVTLTANKDLQEDELIKALFNISEETLASLDAEDGEKLLALVQEASFLTPTPTQVQV